MARPSKLSPEQWDQLARRLSEGEKAADLAREYGVSPTSISVRVSKVSKHVSETARKLAEVKDAMAVMPVAEQYRTINLAEKLRNISSSLASAAELGAQTAHRLHALANSEVAKVDDAEPMASLESLRNVGVLTKLANDSSQIAVNLLSANKEQIKLVNAQETRAGLQVVSEFDDAG